MVMSHAESESSTQMLCTDPQKDFITHVAFDFFGRRIATASSDMTVCVWDLSQDKKEWTRTASWKSHFGPIWKVRWAHPEFGQVLATCSFDRSIQIFEEVCEQRASRLARSGIQVGRGEATNKWVKRTVFNESPVNVTDIQFFPKQLGLILVAGTKNGMVRVYEAPDIMNLSQWDMVEEFDAFKEATKDFKRSETPEGSILERPLLERDISQPYMRFYRAPEEPPKEVPKPPETTISNLRISAMSFSTCRLFRELLAVATDSEDEKADICRVVFFEYPQEGRTCEFIEELTIKYEDSIVSDIAFAPSAGRTHHQIAVAALEDVIIYNIDCEETHEVVECDKAVTIGTTRRKTTVNETTSYTSVEIARLPIKFSGSARIWRLNWNLIGSLLTLGYSDGRIRIWKRHYPNNFVEIGYRDPKISNKKKSSTLKQPPYH